MGDERYFSQCSVLTVKFGDGGIMVRSCFTWFGFGPLVLVPAILNAECYEYILDNYGFPTISQMLGSGPYVFQHYNVSVHTAHNIKQ